MIYTTRQLADHLRGQILGDETTQIKGFAAADQAREGDLTFAEKGAYLEAAVKSAASVILVSEAATAPGKTLIQVGNVRVAAAKALTFFYPEEKPGVGIHPTASIDSSAQIDPSAFIGAGCVIGGNVKIGANAVLKGGNHIGKDSSLGADVTLHPNVVIYPKTQIGNRVIVHAGTVIGSDGYGYVFDEGRHLKVLQVGNVVIGDDVEIGANAAIDRGALGSTIIGKGTKIDNLVHIAHNVVIGQHCLVMGQVGFAGSTKLGNYCVIASQSGIAGHLKLGNQATVGAKSGVMRDIPDGGTVLGIPAAPDKQTKRQWIAVQQLPEMVRKVRDLEQQLEELKALVAGQLNC
ncbi:MAG: UDP-3-O-(3-hydroxymyristoyl)glucosamine N-acyltransferase [Verrucomicrobiales bacterium]